MGNMSVGETLRYAVKNIPYYEEKPEYDPIRKNYDRINEERAEDLLLKLPVIDAAIFREDNYKSLIPKNDASMRIFLTSGSSGKPKSIPRTSDSISAQALSLDDLISSTSREKVFGKDQDIIGSVSDALGVAVSQLPRMPAVSGEIFSEYIKYKRAIEISNPYSTNLLDLAEEAYSLLKPGKSIIWGGFDPVLLKLVGSLDDDSSKKLRNYNEKMKTWLITGGTYTSRSQANLLKELLGTPSFSVNYGTTESAMGLGPHSGNVRLSRYNNYYLLLDNEGLHKLDRNAIGRTGELVITNKMERGQEIAPLINYNLHDIIKIIDFSPGGDPIFEYISRSDGIVHFSVAKLTDPVAARTMDALRDRFGMDITGYFTVTKKDGIDVLTLVIENGKSKLKDREISSILNTLKGVLSGQGPELSYVIGNDLGKVSVEFGDASSIPKGKPKLIYDLRSKE